MKTGEEKGTVVLEREAGVAIVRIASGVVSAIGPDVVRDLREVLREVAGDPALTALVLGGANAKFFSIGWDLPRLVSFGRDQFASFFHEFNRLCVELHVLPKPTIAAITGHAVAGGCILAIACDYRVIAEGRTLIGLNEIKLGVPVPFAADRILTNLVGARLSRDILESGDFYPPEEALRRGIVDEIVPRDGVLASATAKARSLGAMPAPAFAAIKRNRVEPVFEDIARHEEERERLFLDCWFAPPTRQRLKDALATFEAR